MNFVIKKGYIFQLPKSNYELKQVVDFYFTGALSLLETISTDPDRNLEHFTMTLRQHFSVKERLS